MLFRYCLRGLEFAGVWLFYVSGDEPKVSRWVPPSLDWVKLNTNAAFWSDNCVGSGDVVRNDAGMVLGVVALRRDARWPVMITELFAVKEGMTLAKMIGARKLVEEDNLQAIEALRGRAVFRNETQALLQNI